MVHDVEIYKPNGLVPSPYTIYANHEGSAFLKKPRRFDGFILMCVAVGEGILCEDGRERDVSVGDVVLVPPKTLHCLRKKHEDTPESFSVYVVAFMPEAISQSEKSLAADFEEFRLAAKGKGGCLIVRDGRKKTMRNLFVSVIDDDIYFRLCTDEAARCTVVLILIRFFRMRKEGTGGNVHYSSRTFVNLTKYIEQNICRRISLKELAANQHISAEYVCRLFKRHAGMTAVEYINGRRCELIKDLLENTDRPLNVIEDSFEMSGAYLNKLFKKYSGYTLRGYRSLFARGHN